MEGDSDEGQDVGGHAHKRVRLTLSCVACRRRKVKCDRQLPCQQCKDRGVDATCQPETPRQNLEMVDVRARLAKVEDDLVSLKAAVLGRGGSDTSVTVHTVGSTSSVLSPADQAAERAFAALERTAITDEAELDGSRWRQGQTDGLETPWQAEPSWGVSNPVNILRPAQDAAPAGLTAAVISKLPPIPLIEALIATFCANIGYHLHVVDLHSLRQEFEQYRFAVRLHKVDTIHVSWLARLFAILAVAADSLREEDSPSLNMSTDEVRGKAKEWFSTSKMALAIGDWMANPSIWAIQTGLLFQAYLLSHPSDTSSLHNEFTAVLAVVVQLSQRLDLDQLPSDPRVAPVRDPALPLCVPHARQIVSMVWTQIAFTDSLKGFGSPPSARFVKLDPAAATTPPPQNFMDGVWSTGLLPDQATTHHTHATPVLIRSILVDYHERIAAPPTTFAEATKLEESLHRAFTATGAFSPPATGELSSSCVHVSTIVYYHRIMLVHRPLMIRALREKEYEPSLYQSIKAARHVIASHVAIHQEPLGCSTYLFAFTFSAALVLSSILIYVRDLRRPEDRATLRSSIDQARKVLRHGLHGNHSRLRRLCEQALPVLQLLEQLSEPHRGEILGSSLAPHSLPEVLQAATAAARMPTGSNIEQLRNFPASSSTAFSVSSAPAMFAASAPLSYNLLTSATEFPYDWDALLSEFNDYPSLP